MASPFDSQYDAIRERIYHYADIYGIDRNVGVWQIWKESRFDPRAGSPAGAQGIAQFMPGTAARFGVDVWDVESSLNGWGRYMRAMLDMFNGRIDLALAGYNSGENRSEYRNAASENREINWSVLPSGVQRETRPYVQGILENAGSSPIAVGNYLPGTTGNGQPTTDNSLILYGMAAILVFLLIDG